LVNPLYPVVQEIETTRAATFDAVEGPRLDEDVLICVGCGKAIWPNQGMTLMSAHLTDPDTGEAVVTNPIPIHSGCQDAFRERVEGQAD